MQQEYFHLKTHEKHFWKATKSSSSLPPLSHPPSIGSTCVLALTSVQYVTLCPMESSCCIHSIDRYSACATCSKISESARMETAKMSGCEKKTRAPRTLYLKLKAWSVYSIIVEKVRLCSSSRKEYVNEKRELSCPPWEEKKCLWSCGVTPQKDTLNQWQNGNKSRCVSKVCEGFKEQQWNPGMY